MSETDSGFGSVLRYDGFVNSDSDEEEEEEEEEEVRGGEKKKECRQICRSFCEDFIHLDESDCSDTEEMAMRLSQSLASAVQPPEKVISIVQRADNCTVFNDSNVVNTYQQVSPDMHSEYIKQGYDFIRSQAVDLQPVYVETNGTRECKDVLESENALIITGNPGDGKTATAIMTANKLVQDGYIPIVLTSPEEWNNKVLQADKSDKLILFVDNMFGTYGVDERMVNKWLAVNEVISRHLKKRKGNVKIICTVRKKIYNATRQRLKRFRWYKTFRVVDISAESYAMSVNEKEELLKKYFKHHSIPHGSQCKQAAKLDPPHGFPHCVELYCTEPHCRRMGIAFFKSPMPAVSNEIEVLYETRSTQYYALLLVHLSPLQKVSVDIMSGEQEFDQQLLNKTRLLAKLPTRDGMDIVRAIEKLSGVYLKEYEDGSVGFKHDSICELIGVIATRKSPIQAVNYMNLQFLAEKTKYLTYRGEDKNEYAILPEKTKLRLAIRLTDALLNGQAFTACKHHAWDNTDFLNTWLDYVKKNNSGKNECNTLLDDLMTTSLETYYVLNRNQKRLEEQRVGLMFLLFLNKKEIARQEIMNTYHKEAMEESERLSKFRREIRCPSGRKFTHPSNVELVSVN